MTVNDVRPGDVIRPFQNQYQVMKVDTYNRTLVVRDFLGHEITMHGEFVQDFMEKVDDA